MSNDKLTPEQQATVKELRSEIKDLRLEQDEKWAEYIRTGDRECFDTVTAIDTEVEMKGLIAYMPKAGEAKIAKLQRLINKARKQKGDGDDGTRVGLPKIYDSRIKALEMANVWREELGLPLLDRLPPGIVGNSHECVMARAFTWEGEVNGKTFGGVSIGGESTLTYYDENDAPHVITLGSGYDNSTGRVFFQDDEEKRKKISSGILADLFSPFDELNHPDLVATEDIPRHIGKFTFEEEYQPWYFDFDDEDDAREKFEVNHGIYSSSAYRKFLALMNAALMRGDILPVLERFNEESGLLRVYNESVGDYGDPFWQMAWEDGHLVITRRGVRYIYRGDGESKYVPWTCTFKISAQEIANGAKEHMDSLTDSHYVVTPEDPEVVA